MILAQYVIVQRVVGRGFDPATSARIARHFRVTRTAEGGWGLHPESPPYVFVTTLSYVALRLLGLGADDELVEPARRWLHAQPGGVPAIPSWGKFWLALIGLYEYSGLNPCPPELFLLPEWLPVHPRRYYCHTRYIYLGIAYLYGRRFRAELGETVRDLRGELYPAPYEGIDFRAHKLDLAATDVLAPPGRWLRLGYRLLEAYERRHSVAWRRRALERCFDQILYEQRTSRYQAVSPVNGLLNCLAIWSKDPRHPDLAPSLEGLEAWKWEDDAEGIRYCGARSNTWDTAFAMQALLEYPPAARETTGALRRAYGFLRDTQILEELPGGRAAGRDPALGGWCFSDGRHRWPVSDCTAETLGAVLQAHQTPGLIDPAERLPEERLRLAAEFILQRQNDDGGFGTYERRRGSLVLERLNPSEMFGQCMTERSYTECTGSAVRALALLRSAHPDLLGSRAGEAIEKGVRFLRSRQRPDGSFRGFWGIHFTYAAFFVVEALRAAGASPEDPTLVRLARWLAGKQRNDGGWGEHYSGCLTESYTEHPQSQVTMTSWALLALMEVRGADAETVRRGIAWLRSHQGPDGSWPKQAVNGVFFGSAMLDYRLYKSYFPAWALARFQRLTCSP